MELVDTKKIDLKDADPEELNYKLVRVSQDWFGMEYKDKKVESETIPKTYKSVIADEIVKRVINQLNLI